MTPGVEIPPLAVGTLIGGGHRIEQVLGQGGFGVTYRARRQSGEVFAIKEYCPRGIVFRRGDSLVVKPEGRASFRMGYESFKREAETLRDMPRHPGIVGVRALFEKNGTIYIVMDLIDGEPLISFIQRGQVVDTGLLLDFLIRVNQALGFVHDHGILHCDVKPQNIMIRRQDNHPVLIDFGAVRDATDQGAPVESWTESYAPIELVDRSSGRSGVWTDFYSLGAVGYYLATGQKPPPARARVAALKAGNPDPLVSCVTARRESISPALAAVIDRCLGLAPAKRPSSALMLLGMLNKVAAAPAMEELNEMAAEPASQAFGEEPAGFVGKVPDSDPGSVSQRSGGAGDRSPVLDILIRVLAIALIALIGGIIYASV